MIGRWGNFMNVEAYGGPTSLPWRMGIYEYVDGVAQYVEVHPTFLYESLWKFGGLFAAEPNRQALAANSTGRSS